MSTGVPPVVAWQTTLVEPADIAADMSFGRLDRVNLDDQSWVDHVPGWLTASDELFELLLREAQWQQRRRPMYDRVVDEPRLVASWGFDGVPLELPSRVEQVRQVLGRRYHVEFDSVLINLYRDGRDSVAWHGDTVRKVLEAPLVATVSLGERRRFLLRAGAGGRATKTFQLGAGDLLVMGGSCQHDWQHTVPKVAAAGARMSITLRHSRARQPD